MDPEELSLDDNNLASLVVATLGTGGVTGNAASAFGTYVQFGGAPAVCATTHALFHFGGSALRYCHNGIRLNI